MPTDETFPVHLESRTIDCRNERDAYLLKQADRILEDNALVVQFTHQQVKNMIETCEFYRLRTMAGYLSPLVEKAMPDEPAP